MGRTPYRWLDLGALCARLLPKDRIGIEHPFTDSLGGKFRSVHGWVN